MAHTCITQKQIYQILKHKKNHQIQNKNSHSYSPQIKYFISPQKIQLKQKKTLIKPIITHQKTPLINQNNNQNLFRNTLFKPIQDRPKIFLERFNKQKMLTLKRINEQKQQLKRKLQQKKNQQALQVQNLRNNIIQNRKYKKQLKKLKNTINLHSIHPKTFNYSDSNILNQSLSFYTQKQYVTKHNLRSTIATNYCQENSINYDEKVQNQKLIQNINPEVRNKIKSQQTQQIQMDIIQNIFVHEQQLKNDIKMNNIIINQINHKQKVLQQHKYQFHADERQKKQKKQQSINIQQQINNIGNKTELKCTDNQQPDKQQIIKLSSTKIINNNKKIYFHSYHKIEENINQKIQKKSSYNTDVSELKRKNLKTGKKQKSHHSKNKQLPKNSNIQKIVPQIKKTQKRNFYNKSPVFLILFKQYMRPNTKDKQYTNSPKVIEKYLTFDQNKQINQNRQIIRNHQANNKYFQKVIQAFDNHLLMIDQKKYDIQAKIQKNIESIINQYRFEFIEELDFKQGIIFELPQKQQKKKKNQSYNIECQKQTCQIKKLIRHEYARNSKYQQIYHQKKQDLLQYQLPQKGISATFYHLNIKENDIQTQMFIKKDC